MLTPKLEITGADGRFNLSVEDGGEDELDVRSGRVMAAHRAAAAGDLPTELSVGAAITTTAPHALEALSIHAAGLTPSVPGTLGRLHWSFDSRLSNGWPAQGDPKNVAEAFVRPTGGTPVVVAGRKGNAVSLLPGQALRSRWPGILDARPRTIAAWIRIPADTPDSLIPHSIIYWGREGNDLAEMKWRLGLSPERFGEGGVKGALRCEWGKGRVIGTRDLRDGQWHHVAAVYGGGNEADNTRRVWLYLDGQLEGTSSSAHQFIQTQPEAPLQFGGFEGRVDLDEVYIFEGALSPEQVGALSRLEPLPGE